MSQVVRGISLVTGCRRRCGGRDASTAGGKGGSYPWCSGPPAGPVSVVAVAGRRRDPLVSRMGRRGRAKEEGLELELGGYSSAAWRGDLVWLNRTPKRRHFDARSIKTTSF